MKISIIGYGRMGKAIEKIALQRGHEIVEIVKIGEECVQRSDVAIEFTHPDMAKENVSKCLQNSIAVVCGTTGWTVDNDYFAQLCEQNNIAFFYASNFSIGMNILFEINKKLTQLIDKETEYNVEIEETHHINKLDIPSGTALTLTNEIIENSQRYKSWSANNNVTDNIIPIKSFREGEVIGNHKIKWDSAIDTISIEHNAKSRDGFALGAILAAEYINKKNGVFSMKNLLLL
jgi:4-hydroxy-tetrahydrodipicolinate reductase